MWEKHFQLLSKVSRLSLPLGHRNHHEPPPSAFFRLTEKPRIVGRDRLLAYFSIQAVDEALYDQ